VIDTDNDEGNAATGHVDAVARYNLEVTTHEHYPRYCIEQTHNGDESENTNND
jgi:hypothetical protein